MPTISVNRDLLFKRLRKSYTDEEFQHLCFGFGLELDEVTTERQMIMKEQGENAGDDGSDEVIYRIDIPANRYDLLCLEGLVNGILVFQGIISPPFYKTVKPRDVNSLHLTLATQQIRPYAVAAVLRGITFDSDSYNSFIDLQDKLHQNICRKRKLVAIGTHDLDTIQGPFIYDALPPSEIKFKALNQAEEMNASQLMELYSKHAQLKHYLPIIKDSAVYPVIKDKNGIILSMPPIINGDHSKITLNTKNLFIECTAIDLTKAVIVLDTIVCMFSQYCKEQFSVELCKVYSSDGTCEIYPKLKHKEELISVEKANKYIGIEESTSSVCKLLSRMGLDCQEVSDDLINVKAPPTRHDILHKADIYEDLAISFGYNNIKRATCPSWTCGKGCSRVTLSEHVRDIFARASYTEALTFTLCSRDDVSVKLGLDIASVPAVHISNPKTLEFQVARTSLLPGILKTIASNKKMPLPLKLFEVSDVVLKDSNSETGSVNNLHVCCVWSSGNAGFECVLGVLDLLLAQLRIERDRKFGYWLAPSEEPTYFPGRCAEIQLMGQTIGKIGVLHPNVLNAYNVNYPCSTFEITLEPFI